MCYFENNFHYHIHRFLIEIWLNVMSYDIEYSLL